MLILLMVMVFLAICARDMYLRGLLPSKKIVMTIMSNLGYVQALQDMGLEVLKSQVGDRYVIPEILKAETNIGREPSSHIIFLDHNTTGDGLHVLRIMIETGSNLSELAPLFKVYPQVLLNLPGKVILENAHPIVDHTGSIAVVHNGIIENFRSSRALAVIHKDHPNETIISGNPCPLVVSLGKNETYFSSDPNALISFTRKVHFLQDGEGEYEHYTLKEIFDQPQSIRNAMVSRFIKESVHVLLDEFFIKPSDLVSVTQIVIVACETSYHHGMIGSYLFEEMAYIPTVIEISSDQVIAISQSVETADTLAAMRELKSKGAKVFVGVCSTKGFTSQLTVLTLLALMIDRLFQRNVSIIKRYIKSCATCQLNINRKDNGILQSLEIPFEAWRDISIDFLSLPKTMYALNGFTVEVD
ncbi:hypothetical protein ACTFIW_003802 [Dictyostelium discoideum]